MAIRLRLVWSAPARRAPGSPPPAGSPLPPGVAEARALVDAWLNTPFETGPQGIDDLVDRIAAAFAAHDRHLELVPVKDVSEPG